MSAQLIVKCPEYLVAVRDFADRTGQRAQFESRLSDLYRFISAEGYTIMLYEDFAPYSFYWEEIAPDGKRSMNGGLIYHSPHDGFGDGSVPTFSVSLEPGQGWAVHT
jgi:hypothetical protein